MKNKHLLVTVLCLLSASTFAQDSLNYGGRVQVFPSIGANLPIIKLLNGQPTDKLIAYDDFTAYLSIISIDFFFSKHWGMEINMQLAGSAKTMSNKRSRFAHLEDRYGATHYVNTTEYGGYNYGPSFSPITRGSLCLVYRVEKKRMVYYPKVGIGFTGYSFDSPRDVLIKERNSNNLLRAEYTGSFMGGAGGLTAIAGTTIGYKINHRFIVSMQVAGWYMYNPLSYTERIENVFTGKTTITEYTYKKHLAGLTIGGGMHIVIGYRKGSPFVSKDRLRKQKQREQSIGG